MSETTIVTIQIDRPDGFLPDGLAPNAPDAWRYDTAIRSFAWREMAIDEHQLTITRHRTLHVLAIDHRHGTELSIHASLDGVNAALADWATEHWEHKIGGLMVSKSERARVYFTHPAVEEREAFIISTCEVGP